MSLNNQKKQQVTPMQLQEKFYDKLLTKDLSYYDKVHLVNIIQGVASKRTNEPCDQVIGVTVNEIQSNLERIRLSVTTDGRAAAKHKVLELCIRSLEMLLYTDFMEPKADENQEKPRGLTIIKK
jgi:predicted transcriptional regulator YdeE